MNQTLADDITPWEHWIIQEQKNHSVLSSNYDKLCSLVVYQYKLSSLSREMDHQDRITFFLRWWFKNKRFMKKYATYEAAGHLIGRRDHASVYHHVHKRKVSYMYKENTECIKDFLES